MPFRALDAEVVKLGELRMLTALISVAAGLKAAGEHWREAGALFQTKLGEADAIIAAWGITKTLKQAFLWMIDRDYLSDQLLLIAHVLMDKWDETRQDRDHHGPAGRPRGEHPR